MKSIWITILVLAVVCVATYFLMREDNNLADQNENVYCTLDAMQCPDGSYVGRVPPSCEFEECPATTPSTTSGVLDASVDLETDPY